MDIWAVSKSEPLERIDSERQMVGFRQLGQTRELSFRIFQFESVHDTDGAMYQRACDMRRRNLLNARLANRVMMTAR